MIQKLYVSQTNKWVFLITRQRLKCEKCVFNNSKNNGFEEEIINTTQNHEHNLKRYYNQTMSFLFNNTWYVWVWMFSDRKCLSFIIMALTDMLDII